MNDEQQITNDKTINDEQQGKKPPRSDILKKVIGVLVCLVIVVFVFGGGVWIGLEKARYSYRWAESYHKNFGGPAGGFFEDWQRFPNDGFINGHGDFGSIMKIDGSTLVIRGGDNVEKVVLIKDDTVIERFQNTIKPSDLKVDDYIVVIGSPNDAGQIEAKLIRILPAPPAVPVPPR